MRKLDKFVVKLVFAMAAVNASAQWAIQNSNTTADLRDSFGGRQRGVGIRHQWNRAAHSADGGSVLAGLRSSAGCGEAGFPRHSGLRCEDGDCNVFGQGRPFATLCYQSMAARPGSWCSRTRIRMVSGMPIASTIIRSSNTDWRSRLRSAAYLDDRSRRFGFPDQTIPAPPRMGRGEAEFAASNLSPFRG